MKCFLYPVQNLVARCTSALLLLIIIACPALSADLNIAWDPNIEPDVSGKAFIFGKEPKAPLTIFGGISIYRRSGIEFGS